MEGRGTQREGSLEIMGMEGWLSRTAGSGGWEARYDAETLDVVHQSDWGRIGKKVVKSGAQTR